MQRCLKGTDPVYNSLANVAVHPEEVIDLSAYIATNNRLRQSYCVDRALADCKTDIDVTFFCCLISLLFCLSTSSHPEVSCKPYPATTHPRTGC